MMVELDFWVMEQVIMLLFEMCNQGYFGVKMVINLLVVQFVNELLQFYLIEFIIKYFVDVSLVELELIEIVLVVDIECVVEMIY